MPRRAKENEGGPGSGAFSISRCGLRVFRHRTKTGSMTIRSPLEFDDPEDKGKANCPWRSVRPYCSFQARRLFPETDSELRNRGPHLRQKLRLKRRSPCKTIGAVS